MTEAERRGPRARTYEYHLSAPEGFLHPGRSGLESLQGALAGELPPPPIAATLDLDLVAVARGEATFEGRPAEWQYNPLGTVHGGWIATLLDSALGCAVHTALAPGQRYTTTDLQVRFLKTLTASSGVVRAEGKVVHLGRRLATAEARLVGADGALYATATASCLIMGGA